MSRDEGLSVSLEFQGLTVILADQVRDPGLGETNPSFELGREVPCELFR